MMKDVASGDTGHSGFRKDRGAPETRKHLPDLPSALGKEGGPGYSGYSQLMTGLVHCLATPRVIGKGGLLSGSVRVSFGHLCLALLAPEWGDWTL